MTVRVARVYHPPTTGRQETAVLVDRLWPRGVSKADAPFDQWLREVAPSTELRRWFAHDPARFDQFVERYRKELTLPEQATAFDALKTLARKGPLVLMTAADLEHSHAGVLATWLEQEP